MSGASRQKETFCQVPVLSPIPLHTEGHRIPPPSTETLFFLGRRQLPTCCPPTPGVQLARWDHIPWGFPILPLSLLALPSPQALASQEGSKINFFFQPMDEWHGLCQNQTVPAKGLSLGQKIMRWDRKPRKNILGFSGWMELGAVAYW